MLLVACANLGSLLLVRAAGRARDVTIRMARGAGRGRLVRQMLTESVVLASAGGTVGLLVCAWSMDLLLRLAPAGIPRLDRGEPGFLDDVSMEAKDGVVLDNENGAGPLSF